MQSAVKRRDTGLSRVKRKKVPTQCWHEEDLFQDGIEQLRGWESGSMTGELLLVIEWLLLFFFFLALGLLESVPTL